MKHVHPAYDRATVDFDRIAIGTGIQGVRQTRAADKRELRALVTRAGPHSARRTATKQLLLTERHSLEPTG